jgi:lactoylglutathione lyase
MPAQFENVWGYQDDAMALPVADVNQSVPFYERVMGFHVVSRSDAPRSAVLSRDGIQIRIVENGRDPTQDGCAFQVTDVESLFAEFRANGLEQDRPNFDIERRKDGSAWKVFYVVAPDGLCYWFGERSTI